MTEEIIDGEVWKAYPHDPRYLVSNMGRVRGQRGRILKTCDNGTGYRQLDFSNGTRTKKYVHRLVLETFDPCDGDVEACHNNGIRSDNRLVNLRWDTKKNNQADRVIHGTDMRGEKHHQAKLTADQANEVKSRHKNGEASRKLAKEFGVSKTQILRISNGVSWNNENTLSAEVEL